MLAHFEGNLSVFCHFVEGLVMLDANLSVAIYSCTNQLGNTVKAHSKSLPENYLVCYTMHAEDCVLQLAPRCQKTRAHSVFVTQNKLLKPKSNERDVFLEQ